MGIYDFCTVAAAQTNRPRLVIAGVRGYGFRSSFCMLPWMAVTTSVSVIHYFLLHAPMDGSYHQRFCHSLLPVACSHGWQLPPAFLSFTTSCCMLPWMAVTTS